MTTLKAVLFDQDGVLADTERDGHRVAFNQAFQEFEVGIQWDVDTYGNLLKIGGGKERLRHYCRQNEIELTDEQIRNIHERKTKIFMELIESGKIELRPGVKRLIQEIQSAGIKTAVCSTANERAVHTLTESLLGNEIKSKFDFILAGDMVNNKKPDPEIYNRAVETLGISKEECIAIEDSRTGFLAAQASGLKTVVTVNPYTQNEDFTGAALIVSCLGDVGDEKAKVIHPTASPIGECDEIIDLKILQQLTE